MAEQIIGDRYRLHRKILAGDPKHGLPELWQAYDASDLYYIKLWKRRGEERDDIRALWNREVRSLMRLQGYPGATDFFVLLKDLEATDKYYYAVLDGGRRLLFSEVLQDRPKHSWLVNLGEVGRRRPLWEGLLRIAEALSVLHDEGTIHRSLSPASVFVGPDGQGDFRLSGFEWSLRVTGGDGVNAKIAHRYPVRAPELDNLEAEYSPGTDWFDFGLLAAQLFGVPVQALAKRAVIRAAVEKLSTLRVSEKAILLHLLSEDPEQRLANANEVMQCIRTIIRDLSTALSVVGRDLVLAVRLTTDLEQSIDLASERNARPGHPIEQRNWIAKDLSGDIRIVARQTPYKHYVAKGHKFEYRVRPWTVGTLQTWDIGFCDYVETIPRANTDDQYFSTGERKIDVQLFAQVHRTSGTIRDRCAPWDALFPFRKEREKLPSDLRDIHEFFRITQQLDTVLTAAQICPVTVVSAHVSATNTTVELTPFVDADRNELCRHLGLEAPAEQLQDWFRLGAEIVVVEDEDDQKSARYSLLDRRTIGSDSGAAQWKFIGAEPHPSGPRYRFHAQGSFVVRHSRCYLARDHGGTLAQIRRRSRAIEELRSHEALLRTIARPAEVTRLSVDTLPDPPETSEIKLDGSKLEALARLWRTQPLFAIQGPPGTGKTTLVKAFSERLFSSDRSAQILITAHSHHTVDDVRVKLAKLFETHDTADKPIILRLGARETAHDVEPVTRNLLQRLASSELSNRAPDFLRSKIEGMIHGKDSKSDSDLEVRTMQLLVQDAANITFATSNSAELADLAERGRRFDWSIIEEAGKAHGFDMAVALQQSHRLLLIGDHRQLPPFNAKIFRDLLGDPLRVKKAIQTGAQFAPGLVDASLVEDEEGRDTFSVRCNRWRQMVTLFGSIFDNSIRSESGAPGPAATLTDQHRMHPDIADLVGKVFYPNADGGTILRSPPETHAMFDKDPPFVISPTSWLPRERIVWCDVPWVQKKEFAEGEIDGIFASQREAALVVEVLEQIHPRGIAPCEIQILSPYNDQLSAIRNAVERAFHQGKLTEHFEEPFDLKKGKRLGATVDEFQGSEADIVIVSLVRNNGLVPWKSVGFLKEANRMNVLLSRARHKLIIVGSWDFFSSRCDRFTPADFEYAYIGTLMAQANLAKKAGRLATIENGR